MAKKQGKSYPKTSRDRDPRADNYLWISGVPELEYYIDQKVQGIQTKISVARLQLRDIRVKTVKGKAYLYIWEPPVGWKYLGRENHGADFRRELEDKIKSLQEEAKELEKKEREVILKKVGDHLLVARRHKGGNEFIKISSLVIRPGA